MKLRLPHKLQAALVAAIASVSFTTLSTGTQAYAETGETTLTTTFTNAAQTNPANVGLTNTLSKGTASGAAITGSVTSLTNSSGNVLLQAGGNAGTDSTYFTPNTNVGSGSPWTAVFTYNNVEDLTSLDSMALTYGLYNSGGTIHTGQNWTGDLIFTATVTAGGNSAVYVGSYNHPTGNPAKQPVTLSLQSGQTALDLTGQDSFTVSLALSKTWGNTGTFVGIYDLSYALQANLAGALTWAGTQADHDWSHAVWNDGSTPYVPGSTVSFTQAGYHTVAVTTAVTAGDVTVSGQDYTFTLSGSGSLAAKTLTVESGLAITGAGTVSAATIAAAGKTISLDSGVTLRDVTTGQGTLTGAGTYVASSASNVLAGLDTAQSGWTGTIDATVVGDGTNLLDLLTNTHIHGGTVQLQSKGNSVTPGGTETALQTNLANQGRTGNFTLANTTFTTNGALRFNDWQHNHVWTVGSGSGLQVGGDLWMDHGNKLAISGGSVTVGGKLLLGHSGGSNPTGLEMTGGSLKATQIDAYSNSNAANKHIPVSITGGTVEFTTTGNALQIHNSAVCDVTLGGSGSDQVILKAGSSSWTFAYNGMTVGNVTAQTEAGKTITLGAADMSATYTGGLTIQAGSNLKLGGTIARATSGSIDVTGALTLANDVVFNLTNFTHTGAEGSGTYTIFSGSSAVDLSGYGFTVANITGFTGAGQATDYGWTFNADGTISYSTAVEFVWAGTQGEWMASNAWTKNGEPATYVSSPNSSARFGASTGESFVKDIAVNSAVVAVGMVVNDAYTFTLGNGASIAANSITVAGDNASLTINGTGTVVSTTGVSASGKTITVDSGILLQGGTADSFNLDGSGTYALGSGASVLGNVALADSWRGTLKFSNVATYTDINLNTTAFKNTSAVEFDGVTGFWCSGTNEYTRQLILSGQGLTVSQGYSDGQYYFDGGVSGSGDMNFSRSSAVAQNLHFRKDISGWTGSLNVLNGFTVNANFSGQATDVYAGISRTGGTLNVYVGDGTNPYAASFHEAVTASALTVKAQANATFNEAVTLTGDINLNGNSTATFKKAVNAGGTLMVGDNRSTGASATFEDTLQLDALKLSGTEEVPSSVVLKGDTTVTGTFDLSNGGNVRGGVELASGKTLDLQGTIWMNSHTSIALEQDAQVKMGGDLTVASLAGGGSTVTCGANTSFGLANSNFTFTNVQATVNSDQNDVQVKFDNSKFATSHTVTLNNLQSVFRGMDITGGTTTVGASGTTGTVQLGAVALSGGGNLALASGVTGTTSGVTVTGTDAISGGTLKMDADAVITMGASGALTLSGITVNLSAKELQDGDTGYVDTKDVRTKTGNGFAYTEGKVQLVNFTDGGSVTDGGNVQYMRGINSGSLVTTDGDNKGYVIFADTNHAAYFMNVADTTEILSDIQTKAGPGFSEVYLNAGTLDTTDAGVLATMHVNSGEGTVYVTGAAASIITLDGSGKLSVGAGTNLNGTNLNIAAGDTLTLEGGATITYSNISNLGTLDIGEDTTVKSSTITVSQGGRFTTTGEGTLDITTLNITGGTAHLGSNAKVGRFELSQGGQNASTLEIGAGATVEVTGTVTSADGGNGSFMVSNWSASNVLNIEGTMIANSGISTRDGQANINVKNGGTLEMRAGIFKNTDRDKAININVKQGGTLIAAGHDGDYTSYGMRVNLEGGSTLTGYYAEGVNDIAINQTLTASGSLTVDAGDTGKTMTINTGLTGEDTSITKAGEGTLVLSGANTYTGATTVNAGTLQASSLGTGAITVNGGTLELTGAISTTGALTLGNGTTLVFAGADMLTAGSLALADGVTNLTFNLNSIVPTMADTITLATGTTAASLADVNVEVVWTTLPTQYFEHGEVELNEDGTAWVITLSSKGQDLIWNGGEGTWSSADAMWYVANQPEPLRSFNSGDKATFAASDTPAVATLAEAVNAEKVTVESGATVSLQPGEGEVSLTTAEIVVGGALTTSVDVNATAVVASGTDGSWTVAGGTAAATDITAAEGTALALSVSGEGSLTAGTVTANGAIIVTGNLDADAITLSSSGSVSATGTLTAGTVAGSGTVSTAGTMTVDSVTIATGESLTLGGTGTVAIGSSAGAASLNGAGTLVIGGGTVTITGTNNNSFTGNVDVQSGTLKLGDSTGDQFVLGAYNYSAGNTRTITVREGATLDINGKADANYVLTLDGGRLTNNSNTGLGVSKSQVVGLILTEDSYVGDSGHGSEFWLRERSNKPAPTLQLNEFNLTKQGGSTFGLHSTTVTGTGYLVVEAGTVQFDGGSFASNFRMAGGTVSGTVTLAASTTIDATADTTSTISAVLTGGGHSVTKTGTGTVILSAASNYSGGTIINAGTLKTNNATALGTGDVTVAEGATLEMASNLTIAGNLNGSGTISYSGTADGTLNLTKGATLNLYTDISSATGAGKLNMTLNENQDYNMYGTVNVNNITQSASVTLSVRQDADGTGSVTATGTVQTGRLVVGEGSTETGTVFTLDGENAMLGSNHTYSAVVQGYGTFAVVNGATQTLTNLNTDGKQFLGTLKADGANSVLTVTSQLASGVTLSATNGGVINLTQTYTMGDSVAVDGGTVSVSNGLTVNGTVDLSKGTLTQTGGTITVNTDKSLTLGNASITSAIANSGAVTFTQDITATGLAEASEQYSVGADDEKSTNGNYFYNGKRTEGTLTVVTGGGTLTPGGIKVTQGDHVYTLKDDGTATGVTADDVDYSVFLQSKSGSELNSSRISQTAQSHGAELQAVLVIGATLNVDSIFTQLSVANANINVASSSGFYFLDVEGGSNTLSGFLYSLTGEFTQFTQASSSSLRLQNAQGVTSPYQVAAGGVSFYGTAQDAERNHVTVYAADLGTPESMEYDAYSLGSDRFTVEANMIIKDGQGDLVVSNHIKAESISTADSSTTGSLTLANGADADTLQTVNSVNGDIEFRNMRSANKTADNEQTKVQLSNLYIWNGHTVSFYEAAVPTEDKAVAAVEMVEGSILNVMAEGKLEADLVMKAGSTMDVHRAQKTYGLELGCSLTIEPGAQLSQVDLTAISGLTMENRWYFLDTSVEQLHITGIGDWDATQGQRLTFTDYSQFDLDASRVYTQLDSQRYAMVYNWAPAGTNVGTYTLAIYLIPEPTTGTLSLLALAALAARRRRK